MADSPTSDDLDERYNRYSRDQFPALLIDALSAEGFTDEQFYILAEEVRRLDRIHTTSIELKKTDRGLVFVLHRSSGGKLTVSSEASLDLEIPKSIPRR